MIAREFSESFLRVFREFVSVSGNVDSVLLPILLFLVCKKKKEKKKKKKKKERGHNVTFNLSRNRQ